MYEPNKDFVRREQKGCQIASELDREREMGEPTKQERDQVFKRLRGIGPNKVSLMYVYVVVRKVREIIMRGTISKTPQGISG